MSAIRCVIFDCDDTLVDSEILCNRALADELAQFGIREEVDALTSRYRSWRLADIFTDLAQRHGFVPDIGMEGRYRDRVVALFDAELKPIAGVAETLAQLDLPICAASNGPYGKIAQALRVTKLDRFFQRRYFSAYDVGSWKPEPGLFLHAAASMGIAPAECLVVDDSPLGMVAAQRAGMHALHFDPQRIHAPWDAPMFTDMAVLPGLIASLSEVVPA
jgi:HAD superfamily hydrolase (TIGR01509 family)